MFRLNINAKRCDHSNQNRELSSRQHLHVITKRFTIFPYYSLERSDYLVERSDQRMERSGLERSGHGTKWSWNEVAVIRTMGPVTGENLENNRLQRVLLLPLELSKPAQVVQAATKKIGRTIREWSMIHGPNLEPWLRRKRRPPPGTVSKASSI